MKEQEISRLNNSQLLALRALKVFESDHKRVEKVLLSRNGLDSTFFEKLHGNNGCHMESEYLYSVKSGLWDVDMLVEERINMFVRKCQKHDVESVEFGILGSFPHDWDRVSTSRRYSKQD